MRKINTHKLTELNEALDINVLDEPGQGGANHIYEIVAKNGCIGEKEEGYDGDDRILISFQNGPIKEVGVNGISQESLLAILIDRLKSFQNGPFNSEYNSHALEHLEKALFWLHKRTKDRLDRGVEGFNKV